MVSDIEKNGQKDEEKPKKRLRGVPKKPRNNNNSVSNLVREVKKCISTMLPADSAYVYDFLERLFKKFKIKYQVWAFEAILTCLIFTRDKTELIHPDIYSGILFAISATLRRFKERKLDKVRLTSS